MRRVWARGRARTPIRNPWNGDGSTSVRALPALPCTLSGRGCRRGNGHPRAARHQPQGVRVRGNRAPALRLPALRSGQQPFPPRGPESKPGRTSKSSSRGGAGSCEGPVTRTPRGWASIATLPAGPRPARTGGQRRGLGGRSGSEPRRGGAPDSSRPPPRPGRGLPDPLRRAAPRPQCSPAHLSRPQPRPAGRARPQAPGLGSPEARPAQGGLLSASLPVPRPWAF